MFGQIGTKTKWLACLEIDEFFVLKVRDKNIREYLQEFSIFGGVSIIRYLFGSNKYIRHQGAENTFTCYTKRIDDNILMGHLYYRTIVQTQYTQTMRYYDAVYKNNYFPVDETKAYINREKPLRICTDETQINCYNLRSYDDFIKKSQNHPTIFPRATQYFYQINKLCITDDSEIIKYHYMPYTSKKKIINESRDFIETENIINTNNQNTNNQNTNNQNNNDEDEYDYVEVETYIEEEVEIDETDYIYIRNELENSQKIAVAEQEPVVAEQEPVVAEQEPVVAEQEPVVAEEEQVVAEEEPVVAEQEPVVAEEEQVVAEEEQVVAEQEPVVAEQEPQNKSKIDIIFEQVRAKKNQMNNDIDIINNHSFSDKLKRKNKKKNRR
jgi:hypothetical protein